MLCYTVWTVWYSFLLYARDCVEGFIIGCNLAFFITQNVITIWLSNVFTASLLFCNQFDRKAKYWFSWSITCMWPYYNSFTFLNCNRFVKYDLIEIYLYFKDYLEIRYYGSKFAFKSNKNNMIRYFNFTVYTKPVLLYHHNTSTYKIKQQTWVLSFITLIPIKLKSVLSRKRLAKFQLLRLVIYTINH